MKRKLFSLVGGIIFTAFALSSCLGDSSTTIDYTAESTISSFKLGTLYIAKKDTVDTINCAKYPFTIDQLNRTIENRDSLPIGTDISRAVISVTGDTPYLTYLVSDGNGGYTEKAWSSGDTIDFSFDQKLKVLALTKEYGKTYTVKVNVHKQDPKLLVWKTFTNYPTNITPVKAVGVGSSLYVFGLNGSTPVALVSTITNGTPSAWSSVTLPANTNVYSPVRWQDTVYFLAGGTLYALSGTTATAQTISGVPTLTQLLTASDGTTPALYVVGSGVAGKITDNTWTADANATAVSSVTANSRVSGVSYPLSYNTKIWRNYVTIPHTATVATDTIATQAQRTDSETAWGALLPTSAGLPNMENLNIVYHNGQLLAFGGDEASGTTQAKAFQTLYYSANNGLHWRISKSNVLFPEDGSFSTYYTDSNKAYAATTDGDNYIWIVWGNGYLSRGRVNQLGFSSAW